VTCQQIGYSSIALHFPFHQQQPFTPNHAAKLNIHLWSHDNVDEAEFVFKGEEMKAFAVGGA
jgi:hypothetical protein